MPSMVMTTDNNKEILYSHNVLFHWIDHWCYNFRERDRTGCDALTPGTTPRLAHRGSLSSPLHVTNTPQTPTPSMSPSLQRINKTSWIHQLFPEYQLAKFIDQKRNYPQTRCTEIYLNLKHLKLCFKCFKFKPEFLQLVSPISESYHILWTPLCFGVWSLWLTGRKVLPNLMTSQ